MTEIITSFPKRPKWANRQIIAASDLSAEQAWQDAQLARLRRFAMGWGVVAGLEIEWEDNDLRISPGYGITAAGSEIYVPEAVVLTDISELICKACGVASDPCGTLKKDEDNDEDRTGFLSFADRGKDDEEPLTAWLVLKPVVLESCPRPTVPEGCEHPGSNFAYSRQGSGAIPTFVCDLEDALQVMGPECEKVLSYLDKTPVPLPSVEDDILPVAMISVHSKGIRDVDISRRVKLLPMSVMQHIVRCCDCGKVEEDTKDPVENEDPVIEIERPWDQPDKFKIDDLVDTIEDAFPKGTGSFDQSFEDIFASEVAANRLLTEKFGPSLLLQSFAASLLVQTEQDLEDLSKGNARSIYDRARKRKGRNIRDIAAGKSRGDVSTSTVSSLWDKGETGYHSLKQSQGGVKMSKLKGSDLEDLRREFPRATGPELAAALWMTERAALSAKQK